MLDSILLHVRRSDWLPRRLWPILEHGVDERGVLFQHYDTDALDASTLLAAIFGFLPRDDKRLRASMLAIGPGASGILMA